MSFEHSLANRREQTGRVEKKAKGTAGGGGGGWKGQRSGKEKGWTRVRVLITQAARARRKIGRKRGLFNPRRTGEFAALSLPTLSKLRGVQIHHSSAVSSFFPFSSPYLYTSRLIYADHTETPYAPVFACLSSCAPPICISLRRYYFCKRASAPAFRGGLRLCDSSVESRQE